MAKSMTRKELHAFLGELARKPSNINGHLMLIYETVAKSKAREVVELGTREGNSTCALVIAVAETGGHVISVDHGRGDQYVGEPPTFDALVKTSAIIAERLGLGKFWTLVMKDDLEFAAEYTDEVDLLLIDTSHSYEQTKKELETWGSKVADGGFILIPDTASFPEQNKAIWEFLDANPLSEYVEHKESNGLGIIIKNSKATSINSTQAQTENSWHSRVDRMQEDLIAMRARLKEKDLALSRAIQDQMDKLRLELSNQLSAKEGELSKAASDKEAIARELNGLSIELDYIKSSLGYRFTRFYASIIDSLFPDGTRRGELKRAIMRMAGAKVPAIVPKRNVEKKAVRSSRVVLHCDCPKLSLKEPAKVSDWLVVEGWALSEDGIREVRMYLDDILIGTANYGLSRPDVGRAFPHISNSSSCGFRKMVNVGKGQTAHMRHMRINAFDTTGSSNSIEGILEFEPNVLFESTSSEVSSQVQVTAKPSIIIRTKSPPSDFDQTLARINNQGFPNAEIIIVNSGSDDLGPLASKHGAQILSISAGDYEHQRAGNYAVEHATGDYLIFMSDDAIPASTHLLSDMIRVLETDPRIAVATARQIPRSDADLMACYALWSHYRMLDLKHDRVVESEDVDMLSPEERRSICQVDDVCACYRKEIFLKYRFAEGTSYAEDLELGIRLIKDRYKIAQLNSTGVIHSHTRPPEFHLKRTYVDLKTVSRLLSYDLHQFGKETPSSLSLLLDYAFDLYDRVSLSVDDLIDHKFCNGNILEATRLVRKRLTARYQKRLLRPTSGNEGLRAILEEVAAIAQYPSPRAAVLRNPFAKECSGLVGRFGTWVSGTRRDLKGLSGEFVGALYKLVGVELGASLAKYYLSAVVDGKKDVTIDAIDVFLSKGI